jgi:cyanobactin maturation PatA/PatG family protease
MTPARQADILSVLPDLQLLWNDSLGDPEIVIAVLDGPVDTSHPCFQGANLTRLETLVPGTPGAGRMTAHGTHVASLIFGQPGGPVAGIAPRCRGLIAPIFRDDQGTRLSQLDLARAIEQAVQAGAHVINVSGGELAPEGQADSLLARAVRLCDDNGVLLVAATGNDGCACLHVPAALPSVLAVGAMGQDGRPLESSNWGAAYSKNGVLAPGENIPGAVPGGGTALRTGTSFAAPIVAGVTALLLGIQRLDGKKPDPKAVGEAIIESALPCDLPRTSDHRRCLAGVLNIRGAYALITKDKGGRKLMVNSDSSLVPRLSAEPNGPPVDAIAKGPETGVVAAAVPPTAPPPPEPPTPVPNSLVAAAGIAPSAIVPSGNCSCDGGKKSYVFAIGAIGYDFGTEARRDSFRQLMPTTKDRPPNPYATEQMVSYLEANPSESTKLTWTFNLELTPIYAIEAEMPYAREVYEFLRKALSGQIQNESSPNYISRVSLPGVLCNRTVRLFSGQVVPVVVAQYRGLWSWSVKALVDAVVARFDPKEHESVRASLQNFLEKVYYELRNLGQSSQDRALNYSATNAFQASEAMSRALHPKEVVPKAGLYMLDDISVSKSPFCRMDSDCWDVKLRFFDPENERRARMVMRFTVDVSDELPVTLGPVRHWADSSHCC